MTAPAWLKAAADPAEAAAQLHSRLLVAREIGPVYGHGVLPDWVKAGGVTESRDPAGFGPPVKIQKMVAAKVPAPAARPVGPGLSAGLVAAPDRSSGSFMIGGGIGGGLHLGLLGGAGLGLVHGLSKKDKKTPVRSALLGGLAGGALGATAGGLAGGGLAHLYDRSQKAGQAPPTIVGQAGADAIGSVPSPKGVADAVITGLGGPNAVVNGANAIGQGTTKAITDTTRAVHTPTKSLLDLTEGTIRPPLEKLVDRSGLGKNIPDSKSTPGDPLGALGSSIRPAIIGTGIGAGVGLLGGLTGKKKRPLSGMLLGGLAGGLTGGAGGYLYDRFAGHSTPDKPNPTDMQEASDKIDAQAPGLANEVYAGATGRETWSPENLKTLGTRLPVDAIAGAGVGAAGGYVAGRGLQSRENAKLLAIPAKRTVETTTADSSFTPPNWPKGAPPITRPVTSSNVKVESPTIARTPHQGGKSLAGRGAFAGGVVAPAVDTFMHMRNSGVQELDSSNPAVVAEGFQKLTAYSPDLLASSPPAVKLEQQKLLDAVARRRTELASIAQAGQPLSAADRQFNKELKDRLEQAGLIQIQPVGKPRR